MVEGIKRRLLDPFVMVPIFVILLGWGYTVGVRATELEKDIETLKKERKEDRVLLQEVAKESRSTATAVSVMSTDIKNIRDMFELALDKFMASSN